MTFRQAFSALALLAATAPAASRADTVVDFDDLPLAPGSFVNGMPPSPVNGVAYASTFTSGGATFNNVWRRDEFRGQTYVTWGGWSYSNRGSTITTPPGGITEYSAFQYDSAAGGDFGGSGNFGIAALALNAPYIDLPTTPTAPVGMTARITNTTYTVLSILNGDQFAKKFGGSSGNDADFFELTIVGYSGLGATGSAVGEVPFLLADYRSPDNSQDYVVRDWRLVDLSSLIVSGARSLGFRLASSDVDPTFGGFLTPALFAMDDLRIIPAAVVPEPASLATLGLGLGGLALAVARRRRRAA